MQIYSKEQLQEVFKDISVDCEDSPVLAKLTKGKLVNLLNFEGDTLSIILRSLSVIYEDAYKSGDSSQFGVWLADQLATTKGERRLIRLMDYFEQEAKRVQLDIKIKKLEVEAGQLKNEQKRAQKFMDVLWGRVIKSL